MTPPPSSTILAAMKPTKPTELDQKFWQHFAKNIWEKKPLALKGVKSGLLEMTDAEIFELLVLYSDRCRKLNDPSGFKFYIDGFKAEEDHVLEVLPQKKDKSLVGYHSRMQKDYSDYCLVCDELLTVNLKKQHLLTEFTDDLYKHVGFPNRFSEIGLYLGNYRQTPFGVHVDSCGVFSFPVAGTKKFRLWPEGYGQKHPALDRAFKYDKFKKDSTVIEAKAGDMVYWPSSAWHIAESDGSFNATWSLGVWVDVPHKDMFSDSLKELLDGKLNGAASHPTTQFEELFTDSGEVSELPGVFRDSIKVLQNLSALELEDAFLKNWLQHISRQGFKTIPEVDFKITTKSKIKLRSAKSKILWQQSLGDKNTIYLAFGGSLVSASRNSGLVKIVRAMNSGDSCLVSHFLKGSSGKKDLVSLQSLADAGAFA